MYLKKLILNYFRGFEEYEVTFSNFTVLVGENNSGKTSILQAIKLLHDAVRRVFRNQVEPVFVDPDPLWKIDFNPLANQLALASPEIIWFEKRLSETLNIKAHYNDNLTVTIHSKQMGPFECDITINGDSVKNQLQKKEMLNYYFCPIHEPFYPML